MSCKCGHRHEEAMQGRGSRSFVVVQSCLEALGYYTDKANICLLSDSPSEVLVFVPAAPGQRLLAGSEKEVGEHEFRVILCSQWNSAAAANRGRWMSFTELCCSSIMSPTSSRIIVVQVVPPYPLSNRMISFIRRLPPHHSRSPLHHIFSPIQSPVFIVERINVVKSAAALSRD